MPNAQRYRYEPSKGDSSNIVALEVTTNAQNPVGFQMQLLLPAMLEDEHKRIVHGLQIVGFEPHFVPNSVRAPTNNLYFYTEPSATSVMTALDTLASLGLLSPTLHERISLNFPLHDQGFADVAMEEANGAPSALRQWLSRAYQGSVMWLSTHAAWLVGHYPTTPPEKNIDSQYSAQIRESIDAGLFHSFMVGIYALLPNQARDAEREIRNRADRFCGSLSATHRSTSIEQFIGTQLELMLPDDFTHAARASALHACTHNTAEVSEGAEEFVTQMRELLDPGSDILVQLWLTQHNDTTHIATAEDARKYLVWCLFLREQEEQILNRAGTPEPQPVRACEPEMPVGESVQSVVTAPLCSLPVRSPVLTSDWQTRVLADSTANFISAVQTPL